jgi:hypothetical protein
LRNTLPLKYEPSPKEAIWILTMGREIIILRLFFVIQVMEICCNS